MHSVTEDWKSIQNQKICNESYVNISFDVVDPNASSDASSSDNGQIYISDSSTLVNGLDKSPVAYVTLEQNCWLLDGSKVFIPQSDYGDNGYIGNVLSGSDCRFNPVPLISITYSEVHAPLIPGITITWASAYNEFPKEFKVNAYNGEMLVTSKIVTNNTDIKSVVEVDIEGYNRIEIEIIKWCLPYHRARIENIFLGVNKVYTKSDIVSYEHSNDSDPICASLPKNSVTFTIDNVDNKYDPNNVTGLSRYLIERQPIKVSYGFKNYNGTIDYIPAGAFYLSEWNSPQNGIEARFSARDIFEFMNKTYVKGVYSPSGENLYNLALSVLEEAHLPVNSDGSPKWVIDESLESIYTTAPLPLAPMSTCLQYIAQAACCPIFFDREGNVHIEPLSSEIQDYGITTFNMYSRPEIALQKPVASIETKIYNYFVGASDVELYNGSIYVEGTQIITITYNNAATSVMASISGGTLDDADYYANACVLTITANGYVDVSITGTELSVSNTSHVLYVSDAGEVQIVDNPIIAFFGMASSVGQWVKDWMNHRNIIQYSGWRADPRLDALDVITSENKFGTDNVMMTSVKYQYTGSFKGSGEGRVI